MRIAILSMILAVSAMAQSRPSALAAACGSDDINFDVKKDKSQHTFVQPEPGKARLYLVQDLGLGGGAVLKIGLDGAWLGANRGNSYFSASVEPGEHHLCAQPQNPDLRRLIGLTHFTAEAGKTYYFRARLFNEGIPGRQQLIDLGPIDADQAAYFVTSYPLSVSHLRQ